MIDEYSHDYSRAAGAAKRDSSHIIYAVWWRDKHNRQLGAQFTSRGKADEFVARLENDGATWLHITTHADTKRIPRWHVQFCFNSIFSGQPEVDLRVCTTYEEAVAVANNPGVGFLMEISGPHYYLVPATRRDEAGASSPEFQGISG